MGLIDTLRAKGTDLAGQAMGKLFEDERRAEKLGQLVTMIQQGKKSVDALQEAALKGLGVASSGEVKAAGKRLAALRKSARRLDEKLSLLQGRLASGGEQKSE
jgi:hypothetical protein